MPLAIAEVLGVGSFQRDGWASCANTTSLSCCNRVSAPKCPSILHIATLAMLIMIIGLEFLIRNRAVTLEVGRRHFAVLEPNSKFRSCAAFPREPAYEEKSEC